jgi:hypothetical protein
LRLLHKTSNGEVPGPVDERFVFCRVEHHLNTLGRAETLETQEGLGIGRETNTSIARRTNE